MGISYKDGGDWNGHSPRGGGAVIGGGSGSVSDAKPVDRAYILDLISEGPAEGIVGGLKGLKLSGTPVRNPDGSWNIKGVYLAMARGIAANPWIQGFSGVESETAVNVQVKTSTPKTITVSNVNATAVRVKVAFPALQVIDKTNGTPKGTSVQIKIEIQSYGKSWVTQTLTKGDTITDQFSSKFVRGFRIPLTGIGPWQVRLSRLTADAPDTYTQNDTYFESFTTIIDKKFIYPMSCVAGVVVDAKQFSSVPSRSYKMRLLRVQVPSNYTPASQDPDTKVWTPAVYTGEWDGTFKTAWTQNPAWIFYDIVTKKRYGAGQFVNAASIDKYALYTIARNCDVMVPDGMGGGGLEPRYTCNVYLQNREDGIKVLQYFASVFRAVTYWGGGMVVPVQDVDTPSARMVSPSNVKDGRFSYVGTALKARHTQCIVYWNDPANGYKRTPELVQDDDGVARYGINKLEITAFGCTSQGMAHRLGLWSLICDLTETETINFTAGLEGMFYRPGMVVSVADAFRFGKRMGGRIVAATTTQITLDADITIEAGKTYQLKVSLPNGNVEARAVSTAPGTGSVLTVSAAFSAPAQVQGQWQLAASDLPPVDYKILSVKESKGTYQVTGVLHNAAKYAAVEAGLLLTTTPLQAIPTFPQVTGLTVSSLLRVQADRLVPILHADWSAISLARGFDAAYRRDNGPWSSMTVSGTSAEAFDVVPGLYDVRITALYDQGASPFTQSLAFTVGTPTQIAGDAQTAINNAAAAQASANAATARLNAISANSVISDDERSDLKTLRAALTARYNAAIAKAAAMVPPYPTTALGTAWGLYTANVTPVIDGSGDTTINKTNWDGWWAGVDQEIVNLTGAMANYAQVTANTGVTNAATAQATANTGVSNAAAAQATADQAISDAATKSAAAQAAAIASSANTAMQKAQFTTDGVHIDGRTLAGTSITAQAMMNSNASNLWPNPTSEAVNPPVGSFEAAGIQSSGPHTGSKCVRVDAPTAGVPAYLQKAEFSVLPGEQFYLEAWVDLSSSASGWIDFTFFNASGAQVGTVISQVSTAASYAKITGSITAPAGAVLVKVYCAVQGTIASRAGFFDDFYLGKVIVAGMLAANSVVAGNVAAKAITAQNLTVANFDNLIPNPGCQIIPPPPGSWEEAYVYNAGTNWPYLINSALTANGWVRALHPPTNTTYLDEIAECSCAAGDQFYFESMAKMAYAYAGSSMCLEIHFYDKDGHVQRFNSAYGPLNTAINKLSMSATAPSVVTVAGVGSCGVPVKVRFAIYGTSGSGGSDYFLYNQFYARRMGDANVLVEGILKALFLKFAESLESLGYTPGAAGYAPVGVKIAGRPFTITYKDGTTDANGLMELGGNANFNGDKVATVTSRTMTAYNRILNGTFYQTLAGWTTDETMTPWAYDAASSTSAGGSASLTGISGGSVGGRISQAFNCPPTTKPITLTLATACMNGVSFTSASIVARLFDSSTGVETALATWTLTNNSTWVARSIDLTSLCGGGGDYVLSFTSTVIGNATRACIDNIKIII